VYSFDGLSTLKFCGMDGAHPVLPLSNPENNRSRIVRRGTRVTTAQRKSPVQIEEIVSLLEDLDRVIFLDLETTGLSWFYDKITIAGWAYGGSYKICFIDSDPSALVEALKFANAIVTFNGTLFDLRFLRSALEGISIPPVHIDLRFLARRVGLKGGQKSIESALSIKRPKSVCDVDGARAVLLWHQYRRGDSEALSQLIEYNRQDIVGMIQILGEVITRLNPHPDLLSSPPDFYDYAHRIRSSAVTSPTSSWGGHQGPRLTFSDLFSQSLPENSRVVGIDLTGSEKRPSGWCTLRGSIAETDLVLTDDEILNRILSVEPKLVSIDSPLSLPNGRNYVEDHDPNRAEFGIMRMCERELKRRGINVYPCLLPSMQGLTRRGMLLAERIRSYGIPVIESYPGAAQDIMQIPRKGAGIDLLKSGLAAFGIGGPYRDQKVSHDELDAITSAVVGLFFLSGRYEALRGPNEGALIIPNLTAWNSDVLVVGVSGRICAGKTTSARGLENLGFAYTRYSLAIDDEIALRGEIANREARQRIGEELHKTKGQRWLGEKVLERAKGKNLIVVDGLRFPEDHAFLAEKFGSNFLHIHLRSNTEIRKRRYEAGTERRTSFEVAECQQIEASVDQLAPLAAVVISNEASIEELLSQVVGFVTENAKESDRQCLFQSL
jgi:uncharacterized protein YprB with RNaseH-like and TPR domain/predicted nuclease with RNAse H fold/dephospho-CoA kinase